MISPYDQIPQFSLSANFHYIFKLYVSSFHVVNIPLFHYVLRVNLKLFKKTNCHFRII
jgi:hypothetical protein